MRVHHGGRFHSDRGLNRHYRGGEVCFVDGVDWDKVSMTQIHYWANDLGYQSPPIQFWSEEGSGYFPVGDDTEAIEMCGHVSPRTKLLDMYIVCTSERKVLCEEELNVYNEDLDHTSLLGWWIDDVEEGEPNHEILKKRAAAKGKQKVQEAPNKKKCKSFKNVNRRYSTRSARESSRRQPVDVNASSESTTNSNDTDFEGIVDSDFDLSSEEDDIQFNKHVDGDPSRVNEFDDMGFEGNISEGDGDSSEGLDSLHGSSDDNEVDRGKFPVKCRKRYSGWREFKKEDMKNPTFELMMEFPNSEVLKHAIRKHGVLTKKELRFPTNTKHTVSKQVYI